jgi:signal transduction histidine kinase
LHLAQRNHEHAVAVAETRREQLAMTAHDIKQPLTSLRMALMRMDTSDDKTADQILGSFDYLDQLVRTNLEQTDPQISVEEHEVSDQEGVPDTVTPIDPHDVLANNAEEEEQFLVMIVLSNVLAMFKDEARGKGLALKLVPSSASVKTQPIALMRIVSNLVSNAIKYTHEGRVVVGCRQEDETLRIEIHDSGPGIPDDDIERLLQPYERGETPGGTGLGLAVVSDLAQQHGMTFDISSIPGRGTVSKLTVPLH